jgi:hypothetical protein
LAAALLLSACSKNIQTDDAIRKGVIDYLGQNKSIQVSAMDIQVTSVTYKDNEAEAVVSFKPKGGAASTGMQMHYTLEKKGGEWVVKKKADSGAHGAMGAPGAAPGAMPGAMPPPMPTTEGAGQLPAGHPPMGAPKSAPGSGATPDAKK